MVFKKDFMGSYPDAFLAPPSLQIHHELAQMPNASRGEILTMNFFSEISSPISFFCWGGKPIIEKGWKVVPGFLLSGQASSPASTEKKKSVSPLQGEEQIDTLAAQPEELTRVRTLMCTFSTLA